MAQYDGSVRINTEITTKKASAQLMTLENRIVKTADKVASLRSKMDSLKNAKIPTQEYKEIQKQIEDTEKKLTALSERQEKYLSTGGKESSSVYKKMNYDAEQLNQTLEHAKSELQDLVDTGKAFTLGSGTEEYSKIGQQLQYAKNDLSALYQRYSEMEAKNGSTKTSFKGLGDSIRNAFGLAKRGLTDIPIAATKKGVEGLKAAFRGLGGIAKRSLSFMGSKLKNMTASMLGFGKSAKKSSGLLSTLGSRFKGLALSLLIFNQISKAFNAMISGIKEGFSNLYNENMNFKSSVDSLQGSLLTLKNALAGAFAPIVELAIPYIKQLVGWIISAVEAVGQFIAALTGRKTYTKAIKQSTAASKDAAKATKKEADAMKKAEEAAEGYLSPLDEINKYNEDKDKNKGSSAGAGPGTGAGAGVGQMFEEVPIESRFKDIADKLKSFIKSENWEGLGAYIASGINKGLQKIYDVINWENVGPQITYFVNAFTRTFNSLVDNINWDLLGRTIGAGINTIVNTLNLLIEGIDWINLGKSFATGIMGMINEVNWVNLGNLIGNKFMIAWKTFYGFVTSLDYSEIGLALAGAINGVVEKIDLGLIISSLSTFVVGLLEALSIAIQNTDWTAVGQEIANALRAIDWFGIASGLFDVGLQLINGLLEAFGELPLPVQIATTAIGGFLAAFAISSAITGFIGAIQGVIGVIGSVVSILGGPLTIAIAAIIAIGTLLIANWDTIKEKAGELKDWLVEKWESIAEAAKGLIPGIIQGIKDGWDSFINWLGDLWDGIVESFKSFFGIHSPSTVMAELGKYLIEGLLNGIKGLAGSVKQAWDSMKQTAVQTWETVKQNVGSKWEQIKTNSKTTFGTISSNIKTSWDNIKANVKNSADAAKNNIVTAWKISGDNTRTSWDNMKTNAVSAAKTIASKVDARYSEIKSAVRSFASSAPSSWKNAWNSMGDKVSSVLDSVKRTVSNVFGWISDRIKSLGNSLKNLSSNTSSAGRSVTSYTRFANARSETPAPYAMYPEMATLSSMEIPRLATGAVIPANKEFLAVLGDQKHGTNIEAPLDTIKQAQKESLLEVLSELGLTGNKGNGKGNIYSVKAEANRKVLFELMIEEGKLQQMSSGRNPFLLNLI